MRPWLAFSFLSFLAFSPLSYGAACCGGGFAAPALIAGDEKAQVGASVSHTEVVVNGVDAGGFWRKWDSRQTVQTFKLEGAHLLSDRWQAGASVPVIRRTQFGNSRSGLGDLSATLGYEILPDWDYHPIRPRGLSFLQLVFPTGEPRAQSASGLESRGNGFWALGLGSLFTKAIGRSWDLFVNFDIHRSFPRSVSSSVMQGRLEPGFGGAAGGGGGFHLRDWRLGGAIAWAYEDPIALRGSINSDGFPERYATATLSLSYVMSDNGSAVLAYTDQTLFGSPINTSLGRGLALSWQHRWDR